MNMRNDAIGTGHGHETSDDEIDLAELFAALAGAKWFIGAVAGVITLAAGAYAFVTPPVYQSDVLLQVEDKEASVGGMDELSSMFGSDTPAEAEIEILKSRTILGQAVDELGLDISVSPRYFPLIGQVAARVHGGSGDISEPWLGLGSFAWGGERLKVDRLDIPDALMSKPLRLEAGSEGSYRLLDPEGDELLSAAVGKAARADMGGHRIGAFVSVLNARPGLTFEVVKYPRLQVVQELKKRLSVSEQGKGTGIIKVTLESTDPEQLKAILTSIANAYLRQNVGRRSEEAEKTLAFLNAQLPELKTDLAAAESRLNDYRSRVGSVDLTLEAKTFLDQAAELERGLSELRLKRTELIEKFTPRHPAITALDQKVAQLRAEREALEAQIRKMPEEEQESLRLTRDTRVANELYMLLLNKAQEMRIVKAGTVGNARILDPPYLPPEPSKPNRLLILAMGLVLGIMAGVAAALLRHALNKRVDNPDLLEQQLGLPTFASVLHSTAEEKSVRKKGRAGSGRALLAVESRDDLAVEALRSLRTSLQFAAMDASNGIVVITGPSPGIGKSFISANLAATVADAGKRTLLIDADMRRGHLHEYFGVKRTRGLSGLVSGEITREEAVRSTQQPNLDFIPSGILPPNPAELLMNNRFHALLEELESEYDMVFVDTPPVLAVTDASIIGRMAGMTFVVVRSGQHPMREIELTLKRLRQNGVDTKGFIFNDVPLKTSRYAGYYGYDYQYAYEPARA